MKRKSSPWILPEVEYVCLVCVRVCLYDIFFCQLLAGPVPRSRQDVAVVFITDICTVNGGHWVPPCLALAKMPASKRLHLLHHLSSTSETQITPGAQLYTPVQLYTPGPRQWANSILCTDLQSFYGLD